MRIVFRARLLLLVLLAACVPELAPPSPTGFAPLPRAASTPTPMPWVEGGRMIALENAAQIARLGRLDAPEPVSTLFAYAFSPDGSRLAGLNNTSLVAWNLLSGQRLFSTTRADAQTVYYGPDKTEIYTLDSDGVIRIHDADTGAAKTDQPGHPQYSGVAAYYADDGWLAVGGLNGEIKVWDVSARQSLATFRAHDAPVSALAFSPDGSRLASGGQDGTVGAWDWRSRQNLARIEAQAVRLAFSPQGDRLAVGTASTIQVWDVAQAARVHLLETGPGGVSDVLLYAPDGRFVLNGGAIPAMTLWDAESGTFITTLAGMGGDSASAAFSADGRLLVTSVLGGAAALWDMSDPGQALARADLDIGSRQALYVDWSPDGFALLVFEASGPVQVWGIPAAEAGAPG